jgi:hypothetical protein
LLEERNINQGLEEAKNEWNERPAVQQDSIFWSIHCDQRHSDAVYD